MNQPDEGGKGILTTFPFFDPCSYPIQATGLCFQDSETELDQRIRRIGSEFLVPTNGLRQFVDPIPHRRIIELTLPGWGAREGFLQIHHAVDHQSQRPFRRRDPLQTRNSDREPPERQGGGKQDERGEDRQDRRKTGFVRIDI